MAPALNKVKSKHRKLVDHLQKHKIYLDESFSGSDEELLIGYFMGIQADKMYLMGFSDDLREILKTITLEPGELEIMKEAKLKLGWNGQKSEFSSKVIGMIVAKEHATFFKTILKRASDAKIILGLGLFYNVVTNDRTFHRIINWHNDQISHTAILPIIGVTRVAMIKPLNIKRVNGTDETTQTSIRQEIRNSGLFNSIHSSRQTDDEGRWILVVTNKIHIEAATKFFHTLVKSVYANRTSQISNDERIISIPVPTIEDRAQTQARSTNPISHNQSKAGDSIVTDNNKITGGSRMRNMSRPKPRKIVEISFDPESEAQFPHLSEKTSNRPTRPARKPKSNEDLSPTSSYVDSVISAVTRAEFETLSQGIGQMI
jgi:hypothetical protein